MRSLEIALWGRFSKKRLWADIHFEGALRKIVRAMIPVDDYKIVLDGNTVGTILDGKEASLFSCPIDNNAHKVWVQLGNINSTIYVIPAGTLDCPLIARHSSEDFTLLLNEKKKRNPSYKNQNMTVFAIQRKRRRLSKR